MLNLKSKNKDIKRIFQASTGKQFEKNILEFLTDDASYINVSTSKFRNNRSFSALKSELQDMNDSKNVFHNDKFKDITQGRRVVLFQPFGSQQYPDFLLMNDEYIVPLEIKYSTKKGSKPTWNSGLPRSGGFYIFGSYLNSDATFFDGDSLIDPKVRSSLVRIFDLTNDFLNDLIKKENASNEFTLYLRRMYNQQTDLLKNENREMIEDKTISHALNLNI